MFEGDAERGGRSVGAMAKAGACGVVLFVGRRVVGPQGRWLSVFFLMVHSRLNTRRGRFDWITIDQVLYRV